MNRSIWLVVDAASVCVSAMLWCSASCRRGERVVYWSMVHGVTICCVRILGLTTSRRTHMTSGRRSWSQLLSVSRLFGQPHVDLSVDSETTVYTGPTNGRSYSIIISHVRACALALKPYSHVLSLHYCCVPNDCLACWCEPCLTARRGRVVDNQLFVRNSCSLLSYPSVAITVNPAAFCDHTWSLDDTVIVACSLTNCQLTLFTVAYSKTLNELQ